MFVLYTSSVGYLRPLTLHAFLCSLEAADAAAVKSDDAVGQGLAFESRSVFIIDDKKEFRLIFNYPATVGINTAEVLRSVDCLQTAARAGYVHLTSQAPRPR